MKTLMIWSRMPHWNGALQLLRRSRESSEAITNFPLFLVSRMTEKRPSCVLIASSPRLGISESPRVLGSDVSKFCVVTTRIIRRGVSVATLEGNFVTDDEETIDLAMLSGILLSIMQLEFSSTISIRILVLSHFRSSVLKLTCYFRICSSRTVKQLLCSSDFSFLYFLQRFLYTRNDFMEFD